MNIYKRNLISNISASKKAVLIIIVIVAVIVGVVYLFQNGILNPKERAEKKINRIETSRTDVTTSEARGDHEKAYEEARKVANETGSMVDYFALLRVCSSNPISSKSECIKECDTYLTEHINELSFNDSYFVAVEMHEGGFKSESKKFYERAYNTYEDTALVDDVNIMTKDELKQHIDKL